jgi:hypothetical protein
VLVYLSQTYTFGPAVAEIVEISSKMLQLLKESIGFHRNVLVYLSQTYTFAAAVAKIVGISSEMLPFTQGIHRFS